MSYKNTADNEIIINKVADLPAPIDTADGLGTAHRLPDGHYVLGAPITLSNPVVSSGGGFLRIDGNNGVVITYSGTGGFLRSNATTPFGALLLDNIGVSVGAGAQLFDVNNNDTGTIQTRNFNFNGTGGLGTIQNTSAILFAVTNFADFNAKLTIDTVDLVYLAGMVITNSGTISDSYIRLAGTFISAIFTDIQAIPLSGDSFFDIDSAIDGRVEVNTVNVVLTSGGIPFKTGSLDQTDPKVSIHASPGIPDSQTIGSFYMERNTTPTVITAAGVTGTISAFSDAGGGSTTVVTTLTPTDGTIVWVVNDDYAGKYTTANTVLNTSFDIVKAFSGTDTGTWENNWVKVAGTTLALENERASMTDDNEITMANIEETAVNILFSTNPQNDTVAAAKEWEFCIMKNDERLKGSLKTRDMTNRAAEGMPTTTTCTIAGDVFEGYMRNIADGTDGIMVNMTLIIKK